MFALSMTSRWIPNPFHDSKTHTSVLSLLPIVSKPINAKTTWHNCISTRHRDAAKLDLFPVLERRSNHLDRCYHTVHALTQMNWGVLCWPSVDVLPCSGRRLVVLVVLVQVLRDVWRRTLHEDTDLQQPSTCPRRRHLPGSAHWGGPLSHPALSRYTHTLQKHNHLWGFSSVLELECPPTVEWMWCVCVDRELVELVWMVPVRLLGLPDACATLWRALSHWEPVLWEQHRQQALSSRLQLYTRYKLTHIHTVNNLLTIHVTHSRSTTHTHAHCRWPPHTHSHTHIVCSRQGYPPLTDK